MSQGGGAGSRATSIPELLRRLPNVRSEEGAAYAAAFRPRPSDVLIVTYAKAGTTWMQQIIHGLRTGGDMSFDEITEAVPWIETAHDLGLDLDADQAGEPRAFKTHFNAGQAPPGCRYIYILREPKDVAVSFYNFMVGWFLEPGSVSLDAFVREFFLVDPRSGNYWFHLLSWWPRRADPDCLFICYEDMKADLPGTVRRVAGFAGIEADAETLAIATRQAGFDFMKAHGRQFDDHLVSDARNAVCGLPADAASSKLGTGKVGGHAEVMSPETRDLLDQMWRNNIEAELGFAGYDDLRAALAR